MIDTSELDGGLYMMNMIDYPENSKSNARVSSHKSSLSLCVLRWSDGMIKRDREFDTLGVQGASRRR